MMQTQQCRFQQDVLHWTGSNVYSRQVISLIKSSNVNEQSLLSLVLSQCPQFSYWTTQTTDATLKGFYVRVKLSKTVIISSARRLTNYIIIIRWYNARCKIPTSRTRRVLTSAQSSVRNIKIKQFIVSTQVSLTQVCWLPTELISFSLAE